MLRDSSEAVRRKGDLACYIELHIEQGGLLEKAGLHIGVVEGIVGLRWMEVTIDGMANHAGATPMNQRHDAMLAAAKFTVAVNDAITSEPGRQVATVGRITATPNTTNIIPGQVVLTVDLRDLDPGKLARFRARFEQTAVARLARRPARPSRSRAWSTVSRRSPMRGSWAGSSRAPPRSD